MASAAAADTSVYTGTDPVAIRAEMAKLRRATDWANPDAVKAANARLQQLNRQLEQGRLQREAAAGAARGESAPTGPGTGAPLVNQASVMEQVQAAAQPGGQRPLLLADAVREQIVQVYEEVRNPVPDNPAFMADVPVLWIDFSQPTAALLVQSLPSYRGVRHLVLFGGASRSLGLPVDLAPVLAAAAHLPLQTLAIVQFGGRLSAVPDTVGAFADLRELTVTHNALLRLPASVGRLARLEVLQVDGNPLATVLPEIKGLHALRELGLAGTGVTAAERVQISAALPQCKLLTP